MIINLTPHRINIYADSAPDFIPSGSTLRPMLVIEPSGTVARIEEQSSGEKRFKGIGALLPSGVSLVEYSHVPGLPMMRPEVWCVVSLVTALAMPHRPDLLVPWKQVRNHAGAVIGCRTLARPLVETR